MNAGSPEVCGKDLASKRSAYEGEHETRAECLVIVCQPRLLGNGSAALSTSSEFRNGRLRMEGAKEGFPGFPRFPGFLGVSCVLIQIELMQLRPLLEFDRGCGPLYAGVGRGLAQ